MDDLRDNAPAFQPCEACGALILPVVWVSAEGKERPAQWRPLDGPVTALLGLPHVCTPMEES